MTKPNFDVRDFRRTLGQFPTGVTVVTTVTDSGKPVGVTASSFNSVSVDPPLVLWSIDKSSFSKEIFEKAEYFAVNILGKDQISSSNNFAGRGEDKFKGVSFSKGQGGAPLLPDCAAQFECKTWNVYEGGDHLIIVGEVVDYRRAESVSPLVFSRGSYAIATQHPATLKNQESTSVSSGQFLDDYLLYLLNRAFSNYSAQLYPLLMEACDTTPEEWRVITALSGSQNVSISELASFVGQPQNILSDNLSRIEEKGYILSSNSKSFKLTEKGLSLREQLTVIAKQHEEAILSALPEGGIEILKSSLKSISEIES